MALLDYTHQAFLSGVSAYDRKDSFDSGRARQDGSQNHPWCVGWKYAEEQHSTYPDWSLNELDYGLVKEETERLFKKYYDKKLHRCIAVFFFSTLFLMLLDVVLDGIGSDLNVRSIQALGDWLDSVEEELIWLWLVGSVGVAALVAWVKYWLLKHRWPEIWLRLKARDSEV